MSNEFLLSPKSFKNAEPFATPYYRASDEWDRRIGQPVVQARNWRIAFFLSSLLTLILSIGLIYQAKRREIIPIIVGIDKERGEPVVVGRVGDDSYRPQIQELKYFLSQFVLSVRSVPMDPVLIKQNWLNAYKFLRPESSNMLNDLTNKDPDSPLKKIGQETVITKPISVVQVSNTNSYQMRWEETVYNKQGSPTDHYVMNGIFTIEIESPKTEDTLLANPLGLYITNFQWNKEL